MVSHHIITSIRDQGITWKYNGCNHIALTTIDEGWDIIGDKKKTEKTDRERDYKYTTLTVVLCMASNES